MLTVPLSEWAVLVRKLQAPPSAGVLALSWIASMLGGWEGVVTAGVGAAAGKGAYHLADRRRRAGGRHDWVAESRLVGAWRSDGLRCIGGGNGSSCVERAR